MTIAIIGGGPAGLSLAAGVKDAVVFEEHDAVGLPRHCTSLVGSRAAEEAGLPPGIVVNKYGELFITDWEGHGLWFKLRHPVYLIDRPGLEQKLAERVERLELGKRVTAVGERHVVVNGEKKGPFDYIVIAEGAARKLSSRFGHVVRLPGLQIDAKSPLDLPGITVIYNAKISKGYFAWVVQIDRGLYRIGLADVCCTPEKLRKLLKILKAEPAARPFGGGVLAGPPLARLTYGRLVLVGDAGGLTKPLSGGGIVLALKSGREAARALASGKPELYEQRMAPIKLRLKAAFHAMRYLYGRRLVDMAIRALHGGEYIAVDYDDHLLSLAAAALMDPRSLGVAVYGLRALLTRYDNAAHFLQ